MSCFLVFCVVKTDLVVFQIWWDSFDLELLTSVLNVKYSIEWRSSVALLYKENYCALSGAVVAEGGELKQMRSSFKIRRWKEDSSGMIILCGVAVIVNRVCSGGRGMWRKKDLHVLLPLYESNFLGMKLFLARFGSYFFSSNTGNSSPMLYMNVLILSF